MFYSFRIQISKTWMKKYLIAWECAQWYSIRSIVCCYMCSTKFSFCSFILHCILYHDQFDEGSSHFFFINVTAFLCTIQCTEIILRNSIFVYRTSLLRGCYLQKVIEFVLFCTTFVKGHRCRERKVRTVRMCMRIAERRILSTTSNTFHAHITRFLIPVNSFFDNIKSLEKHQLWRLLITIK